jgi:hypothetical protein
VTLEHVAWGAFRAAIKDSCGVESLDADTLIGAYRTRGGLWIEVDWC